MTDLDAHNFGMIVPLRKAVRPSSRVSDQRHEGAWIIWDIHIPHRIRDFLEPSTYENLRDPDFEYPE